MFRVVNRTFALPGLYETINSLRVKWPKMNNELFCDSNELITEYYKSIQKIVQKQKSKSLLFIMQ